MVPEITRLKLKMRHFVLALVLPIVCSGSLPDDWIEVLKYLLVSKISSVLSTDIDSH